MTFRSKDSYMVKMFTLHIVMRRVYLNCRISFKSQVIFTRVQNLQITIINKARVIAHILVFDPVI